MAVTPPRHRGDLSESLRNSLHPMRTPRQAPPTLGKVGHSCPLTAEADPWVSTLGPAPQLPELSPVEEGRAVGVRESCGSHGSCWVFPPGPSRKHAGRGGGGGAPTHRRTELEAEDNLRGRNCQSAGACHSGEGTLRAAQCPWDSWGLRSAAGGPSLVVTALHWGLRVPTGGYGISGGCQFPRCLPLSPSLPGLHPAVPVPGCPPWALDAANYLQLA